MLHAGTKMKGQGACFVSTSSEGINCGGQEMM